MNLRWSATFRRFEAEFEEFNGDLAAVKAAGFRTDGAPEWTWYTYKVGPLTKLRTNRPASGLTITAEAKEQYIPLAALEEKNAKVKAEATAHNKALKKKADDEKNYKPVIIPEKGYIDASDLPPVPSTATAYNPPPPPDTKCIICDAPVYFYEKQNPPTCLFCEKNVLDSLEVC